VFSWGRGLQNSQAACLSRFLAEEGVPDEVEDAAFKRVL
jgi:hypothetical protein